MNLGSLVVKFPGLVYPDRAPVSPGGLIGYITEELKKHPEYELLQKMADKAIPAKPHNCPACGREDE